MANGVAAQPYAGPLDTALLRDPAVYAAGIAGARRVNSGKPNQREHQRGVSSSNLPRQSVAYITTDRMLAPNQSGGIPDSPQGSEVLAYQAAMTAAMMGKLGGP